MIKEITRKERLDAALTNYHAAYSKYRESIETLLPIGAIVKVRYHDEIVVAEITGWTDDFRCVHTTRAFENINIRACPRVGAIVEILEVPQ